MQTLLPNIPQLRLRIAIREELDRRCEADPKYSLRAFAKALGMSHSLLSLVLAGKRNITRKKSAQILKILDLDLTDFSVSPKSDPKFDQMSRDHLALRAEWHHSAILSILETRREKLSAKKLGQILGIQEIQARTALDRLQRLGLISLKNGKWSREKLAKALELGSPRQDYPKYIRKMLQRSLDKLDSHNQKLSRFSATIVSVESSQIPELLRSLDRFRAAWTKRAEKAKSPNEVYCLNLQCFELT